MKWEVHILSYCAIYVFLFAFLSGRVAFRIRYAIRRRSERATSAVFDPMSPASRVGALAQVLPRSQCKDLCNHHSELESANLCRDWRNQWITIRGGNRNSDYAAWRARRCYRPWGYAAFRSWLKYFTVVQWDQQGAGRTFRTKRRGIRLRHSRPNGPGRHRAGTFEEEAAARTRSFHTVGAFLGSVLGFFMVRTRATFSYAFIGTPAGLLPNLREALPSHMTVSKSVSRRQFPGPRRTEGSWASAF